MEPYGREHAIWIHDQLVQKLWKAIENVAVLQTKLAEAHVRLQRATRDVKRGWRWNHQMRCSVLEGLLHRYRSYANELNDRVVEARARVFRVARVRDPESY